MYVTLTSTAFGSSWSCPCIGAVVLWNGLAFQKDRPASALAALLLPDLRKIFSIVAVAKFKHGKTGCYGQLSLCDWSLGETDGILRLCSSSIILSSFSSSLLLDYHWDYINYYYYLYYYSVYLFNHNNNESNHFYFGLFLL